jgi:hypothetical protein
MVTRGFHGNIQSMTSSFQRAGDRSEDASGNHSDKKDLLPILLRRHFNPLAGTMMPPLRQAPPWIDTWRPMPSLSFDETGFLPEGVHEASIEAIKPLLVTNPQRERMWDQLNDFLTWPRDTGNFSHAYIGGGFASQKPYPSDVDLILHVRHPFGDKAFMAMEPFFAAGLDSIFDLYSVHLHFWIDGFPGDTDFRSFFQYVSPHESKRLGLGPDARKGLIKLKLLLDNSLES